MLLLLYLEPDFCQFRFGASFVLDTRIMWLILTGDERETVRQTYDDELMLYVLRCQLTY